MFIIPVLEKWRQEDPQGAPFFPIQARLLSLMHKSRSVHERKNALFPLPLPSCVPLLPSSTFSLSSPNLYLNSVYERKHEIFAFLNMYHIFMCIFVSVHLFDLF